MWFAHTLRRLRQSLKAGRVTPRPRKPLRRRLDIEDLENRLTPSCLIVPNPLTMTIHCTPANDTLTVRVGAPGLNQITVVSNGVEIVQPLQAIQTITINTGDGDDTVNVQKTIPGRSLVINGGNHNDTVVLGAVDHNLSNLMGPVTANGGPGANTIVFHDDNYAAANSVYNLNVTTLSRTASWVYNYSDFGTKVVNGSDGANTTFNVEGTSPGPMTLNSGIGVNTVHVKQTSGPLTVNGQNGQDTVIVGNSGNLSQILGNLHITNALSRTALTIDDSAGAMPRNATLTDAGLSGLSPSPISWVEADLLSLSVKGSAHGNTFTVADTPANPGFQNVALRSGTGVDTVHVQRTSSPLGIDGQSGLDTVNVSHLGSVQQITRAVTVANPGGTTALTVNDSADPAARYASLSGTSLTGLAPALIGWSAGVLRSLVIQGGSGGNTFTVSSTPTNAAFQGVSLHAGSNSDTINIQGTNSLLHVDAGGGNDLIQMGNYLHSLDFIHHLVRVVGGAGTDRLVLNDFGSAAAQQYGLNAGIFYRQSELVQHTTLETLTLHGTVFDDSINVSGNTPGMTATLHAGGGWDTLTGTNSVNTFVLNELDAGVLNQANSFDDVENLVGFTGTDTFTFANAQAALSGRIEGGDGADTLDYAALASDVTVNMSLYAATGVGAFIYQVENAIGGAGNDILVGDDQSNVLDGGDGRDLLIAGGAFYGFNPDALQGGDGEDILIAGWTLFDWDPAVLHGLRDVWAGAGDNAERVAALRPYLNADTVFSNSGADGNALTGGADLDWFFARSAADLHDGDLGEEVVAIIS